jgi:hypothetical protein
MQTIFNQPLRVLASACLTVLLLLGGSLPATAASSSPAESAIAAAELFENAYKNRYTWERDFPGYMAEVSVNTNEQLYHGIVRVNPDASVLVMNVEDEGVSQLIRDRLKSEAIHRQPVPFDVLHGSNQFKLVGKNEDGDIEIRETGKGKESRYKVREGKIIQVKRNFDEMAVTVDTVGTTDTPEGYLVSHYKATFRDADTGEIVEKRDVRNFYEKIGKYYLLTNQQIRTTRQPDEDPEAKKVPDTMIRFNDVQPI